MIAALHFCGERRDQAIRPMRFRMRSTLPLRAVCLVANGVRERLASLLSRDFECSLSEPVILDNEARRVLFASALAYRVCGRLSDAFILVRPLDARRLVCAAFGETERPERTPLSEIERTTLERIVAAIGPLCEPLCGQCGKVTRDTAERADIESSTYFEVRTMGEGAISLGFSLSSDPPEEVGQRIQLENLLDITLRGRVECARGEISLEALSCLQPGMRIPLRTHVEEAGVLRFGGLAFARGVCGSQNGMNALTVVHNA
jgi:flagellar motor switch/type III secretory pathway protein FliN